MHEVTPSAVAMADSTLMAVWIANFQNVLFFIMIWFNGLTFVLGFRESRFATPLV